MAQNASPAASAIGVLVAVFIFGAGCTAMVMHHDDSSSGPVSITPTTPVLPSDEQQALDAVSGDCTETPSKLDAEAAKTVDLLDQNGVVDETTATVLQHLKKSIPESAPVMDCSQLLAVYIQLRSPHN